MSANITKFILGQVGGFPLRMSWLPRLVDRYKSDKKIPRDTEKIACELGIGKNMAKALRIWALASGVIDNNGQFSPLARRLFVIHDPFLEKEDSIALLHWLISSNVEQFTANTWLFNFFRASTFTLTDSVTHFSKYLSARGKNYADGTIRADVETAVRMHAGVYDKKFDEVDDRFFYPLRLLTKRNVEGRMQFTRTWEHNRPQVSPAVLNYALLQVLAKRQTNSSSLTDLYIASNNNTTPGATFGFTLDGFFTAIENIVNLHPHRYSFVSMPGGNFSFQVEGRIGKDCEKGNLEIADQVYFQDS